MKSIIKLALLATLTVSGLVGCGGAGQPSGPRNLEAEGFVDWSCDSNCVGVCDYTDTIVHYKSDAVEIDSDEYLIGTVANDAFTVNGVAENCTGVLSGENMSFTCDYTAPQVVQCQQAGFVLSPLRKP